MGRKVREEAVNERPIIEMHIFLPGAYLVSFLGSDQQLLATKKLIVQPY